MLGRKTHDQKRVYQYNQYGTLIHLGQKLRIRSTVTQQTF